VYRIGTASGKRGGEDSKVAAGRKGVILRLEGIRSSILRNIVRVKRWDGGLKRKGRWDVSPSFGVCLSRRPAPTGNRAGNPRPLGDDRGGARRF